MGLAGAVATLWVSLAPMPGAERPVIKPGSCYVRYKNERLFIGSGECMRKLPPHDLSGYVTLGFEEACFAPTLRQARTMIAGNCEYPLLAPDGVLPFQNDSVRRLFRVTLRVKGDSRKGLYGRGGVWSHGYYVLAIKSRQLVRRLN